MLPLVDQPLIQLHGEEAVASGIEDIIVITGRGKRAIEDHFGRSVELEENLKGTASPTAQSDAPDFDTGANFLLRRQSEAPRTRPCGLCAQHLIGDEPSRHSRG